MADTTKLAEKLYFSARGLSKLRPNSPKKHLSTLKVFLSIKSCLRKVRFWAYTQSLHYFELTNENVSNISYLGRGGGGAFVQPFFVMEKIGHKLSRRVEVWHIKNDGCCQSLCPFRFLPLSLLRVILRLT